MAYISPCISDTDCIDLGLNVDGELEANLIVAPSGGLECTPVGAGIKIDPASCNGATLSAAGLYVPAAANSRLFSTGIGTAKPGVQGVSDNAFGLGIEINWDTFADAGTGYPISTGIAITNPVSISLTNTSCYVWNIEAAWNMGPTQFKLRNGWLVSIGQYNSIASPHFTASPTPGISLDTVSDPLVTNRAIGVGYPPSHYRVETFLNPGESATVSGYLVAQWDVRGTARTAGGGSCATNLSCNQSLIFFGLTIWLAAWSRE